MTTMNDDPLSAAPLDEQLVAYLDGELDPESCRHIEELLASQADVRRRLQEMERTWDLLDDLDAAPAADRFTQTTLEMVAVAARRDVEANLAEAPRRRRRRVLVVVGSLLAAAAVGVLGVFWLRPDPNALLVQDLSVIQNLDQYRAIEDIEFLKLLRAEKVFPKDDGETPGFIMVPPNESPAERRRRIESMSPEDKEKLARLEVRFELDPNEQKCLVRLDTDIRASADADELRKVMHRYCEWLKDLPSPSSLQLELAGLKPAERITKIKQQLVMQAREGGKLPGAKDMEVLSQWMDERAKQHEAQILKSRPSGAVELREPMRHLYVLSQMWRRGPLRGPGKPAVLSDDDLAGLLDRLSSETRRELESKSTPERWQWVAQSARHVMRRRPAPKVGDERLVEFFEQQLKGKELERLLSLPGEEMQRELQRLYDRQMRGRAEGSGRGNPPDGERPASSPSR